MRVGKARTLEIGHGIGLAPDDVVQDPESQILQDGTDAEDVVITADHPDRAIGLEQPPRFAKPFTGKAIVRGKAVELVPVVGHRVHVAAVRPGKIAAKLEVVGRIGEDHVDRGIGQRAHHLDAVAAQDAVHRQDFGTNRRIWRGAQGLACRCDCRPSFQCRCHCVRPCVLKRNGESFRLARQVTTRRIPASRGLLATRTEGVRACML